ncbi:MAG: M28 family peptidase [Acidobacteria bacterium]|nr:M28 family peptidase [Acidobacteriota bacterium]
MARRSRPRQRNWTVLWAALAVAAVITALLGWSQWTVRSQQPGPIGKAAMEHAVALVALGPRPVGSEAHRKMEQYIIGKLQAAGAAVDQDIFTAQTPVGEMGMTNIVGRMGKTGGRILVLATHYDTKLIDGFVGANDGGSSTGLVLALAPILAKEGFEHEIRLVFLDGEEAFGEWSDQDSLYGSRHLAAQWKADGTASRIGAFILVDMIGDAELELLKDSNSTPWLRDLVWKVAARLGHSRQFLNREAPFEDDHLPFVRAGVPAVDLIDLNYGPGNRYWHTTADTLDKISAASMQLVGDVVLESIRELDRQR